MFEISKYAEGKNEGQAGENPAVVGTHVGALLTRHERMALDDAIWAAHDAEVASAAETVAVSEPVSKPPTRAEMNAAAWASHDQANL